MGYYQKILDSPTDAPKWLVDHSDDIPATEKAVASVIPLAEANKFPFTNDVILRLYQKYPKASEVLVQRAESERPLASALYSANLCGIWRNPTAITKSKPVDRALYNDLSKFLEIAEAPAQIEIKKGELLDTTILVAEALFANAPTHYSSLTANINLITFVSTTIQSYDGQCVINAAHAFYDVPLGASSSNNAWHSAIRVDTTTTESFRRARSAPQSAL